MYFTVSCGSSNSWMRVSSSEAANLIARGRTNREIADELVIAPPTAERHVANILGKLGFSSRTQLAAWIYQRDSR